MKSHSFAELIASAGLVAGLLTASCAAQAQTQTAPPAPNPATQHAPDGGTTIRIQSITIPPLESAPFSATVVTVWTKNLADGTTATIKNHRTVARDSTGKIFEERRAFTATGDTQVTRLAEMDYADPVRHELLVCIPEQKTCHASQYRLAPMQKMPAGTGGLQMCGCASRPANGITIQQEALGQQMVENLDEIGSREVTTLPAGTFGNGKAQPIVKEFWYSPRLGINMMTKRFDPRSGAENFEVENVSLDEPDPKLFEPPADYQIVREVVERPGTPATPQTTGMAGWSGPGAAR
jgi:hypothetical protein